MLSISVIKKLKFLVGISQNVKRVRNLYVRSCKHYISKSLKCRQKNRLLENGACHGQPLCCGGARGDSLSVSAAPTCLESKGVQNEEENIGLFIGKIYCLQALYFFQSKTTYDSLSATSVAFTGVRSQTHIKKGRGRIW